MLNGEVPPNFSGHTLDKATKAKLTLENYYSNLVSQHRERRQRWERLEETLKDEAIPEEQRSAPFSQLFLTLPEKNLY